MAKKQRVSEAIQNKFNKPQFKIGDAVHFSWLGQKKYGHVTKTKQTGWGIQYMVETNQKRRYPCGIQISNTKTQYDVGYIFFEETKTLGDLECTQRAAIQTAYTTVIKQPIRTEIESGTDLKGSRRNDAKDNGASKPTRKERSSKPDANDAGTAGANRDNTTKRKNSANSELDSAIEKQRNFLSGFIKKD
jgi:hypothetical protein